ncbi:MAG: hypothetical protein K2N06_09325 [Oscillospiraceae bacterium]|nr:hypothetical protein [Oscillospiraceae bacterium]
MNKFFRVLGYILGIIWLLVLIFFISGIYSEFKREDGSLPIWIILIPAWFALVTAVIFIVPSVTAKKQRKKEREYREKNISNIILSDDFFGVMVFEHDSELKTLDSKDIKLPPFGADSPEILEIYEYSEDLRSTIFGNLRELYNHADELLEQIYPEFLETCNDYEEVDERGNPYTLESLRKSVYVNAITVMNNGTYFELEFDTGYVNFGGHGFVACVNFSDKTLDFNLEG